MIPNFQFEDSILRIRVIKKQISKMLNVKLHKQWYKNFTYIYSGQRIKKIRNSSKHLMPAFVLFSAKYILLCKNYWHNTYATLHNLTHQNSCQPLLQRAGCWTTSSRGLLITRPLFCCCFMASVSQQWGASCHSLHASSFNLPAFHSGKNWLQPAHCVQSAQSESSLEVLNEMQMSY